MPNFDLFPRFYPDEVSLKLVAGISYPCSENPTFLVPFFDDYGLFNIVS
jgi:hypothetical protein